jgi:TPR repeat protein
LGMRALIDTGIALMLFATPVVAGDLLDADLKDLEFEDGVAAYNAGDYPKACRIFKINALFNLSAQYNLAMMYRNGEGVPKNYAEAAFRYDIAAQQGHAEAQYRLA